MSLQDESYYEVFRARMTADGTNMKDQIESLAKKNFKQYLAESPNKASIVKEGLQYSVVILTNKQDEYRLTKEVLSDFSVPIAIGDLLQWENDVWLVWKKQENSLKDYNCSYICRCNHKIKWVSEGLKYEQYVYEFSSKETIIRSSFASRVQSIIVTEPNKYMEIIMPKTTKIAKEQRFIIDGEAWYVIEYDNSSVPGLTYLSLGETTKDLFNDSIEEELADVSSLGSTYFSLIQESPIVAKDEPFTLFPVLYKEGVYVDNPIIDFYIDGIKVHSGSSFTHSYSENTEVVMVYGDLRKPVRITVGTPTPSMVLELIGNDTIKWGRTAEYIVRRTINGEEIPLETPAVFTISDPSLATLTVEGNDTCYVQANSNRQIGSLVLTATVNGTAVSKIISIVSLW